MATECHQKEILGLHVKCPIFLSDFNQIWIFLTDFFFVKVPNIKFHGNVSSGNCNGMCRQIDGGWIDGHDKDTCVFHNYMELPNNVQNSKF
jgi:hypothetical protein